MLRKIFLQPCCWLLCTVFLCSYATKAQQPLRFSHFTVENGLSSPSALCVTQDEKGFLWIGTMDGLNRYDGERVKVYKDFYRKVLADGFAQINALHPYQKNLLLVGTNSGLFMFDSRTDSFQLCCYEANDFVNDCKLRINAILVDSKERVWVASNGGLSLLLNKQNGFELSSVHPSKNDAYTNGRLIVQALCETVDGTILAGTDEGIIAYAPSQNNNGKTVGRYVLKGHSITSLAQDNKQTIWAGTGTRGLLRLSNDYSVDETYQQNLNNQNKGLLSNIIRKVYADKKGQIWIGTLKGLNILNSETLRVESYYHHPADKSSLNFNSIYDIYEDRQGNVWIATYFGGLNSVHAIPTAFQVYQNEERESALSSNIISAITDDAANNLWIGTEAEGLNYFDRKKKRFQHYKDGQGPAFLSSNLVKTLIRDQNNHIWVGMQGGGINVLDEKGRNIAMYGPALPAPYKINSANVACLMQDNKNRIWIGNALDGINIYDFSNNKTEKFEDLYHDKRLSNVAISFLYQDRNGNVWVGTWQGLYLLQPGKSELISFLKSNSQLQSNRMICIAEDATNNLWIGTSMGLSCFDAKEKTMRTYTVSDGLSSNKVVGIVADAQNNLWVSTDNGLNRLSADRTRFYKFDVHDGLPGNVFNNYSFFKDKTGHLFFGGYNGLIEFDPAAIGMNKRIPEIVLTDLRINEQLIHARDSSGILQNDISETHDLTLRHDQNIISLEFAVMNFIKPAKNRSAYMLDGYNNDWIYTDAQKINFTNLPTGNYVLKIRGANNDGIWNDVPYSINIKVLPPPWKSWWAYSLYTLFVLLLAAGIIYFFASRTAMRRKLHYEHMMNVKQQELHQMKVDFFTHISHELRTPLSLIIGPVEMLQQTSSNNLPAKKLLDTIMNNAERLLKLTDDLLEFRKADAGYTQLKVQPVNLTSFVQSVFNNFVTAAAKKSIDFTLAGQAPGITVYFDPHLMEIVLSNLLSNALKFTKDGGIIKVEISSAGTDFVEIIVKDNGVGIPEKSQDKIFASFYQADAGGIKNTGSGIGLAFSKSLMELHKGNLRFRSGVNAVTGKMETEFVISVRLGKDHFNDAHLISD